MARSAAPQPLGNDSEPSIGDLVSQAIRDVTQLVRCELALAKLELRDDAKRLGLAAALLVIAAFAGCLILVMLCFAFAYGLITLGIWPWAAFLIVAGVLLLLASLAILIVVIKVRGVSGLRKTRQTVQQDLALLKRDEDQPARPRSRRADPMTLRGDAAVYVEGPWSHRAVSANGTRLHVAESGDGPLVLLLHGFPQFWWTWREQLATLAAAGYRAVAPDLRGYGGSDKPPRGYDLVTAASDAAGLIRALGEANAVVVGHDWGGLVAWTMAAYYPKVVAQARPSSRWRTRCGWGPRWSPTRWARAAAAVTRSASRFRCSPSTAWSGIMPSGSGRCCVPGRGRAGRTRKPSGATGPRCASPRWRIRRWSTTAGSCAPGSARTALRYARRMRAPIQAPTLHLQGALDTCVLPATARGSGRHVDGPYRWRLLDGAGHFPHEEQPDRFDRELRGWLADPEPER